MREKAMRYFCLFCLFITLWHSDAFANAIPEDKASAVVIAYHRINEDHETGTNLKLEQFEQHIDIIKNEEYNVIKLPELISNIKQGKPLPPKTVAITLEGGFKSAFKHAVPRLLKENIPFTVFYASDQATRDTGEYMNWAELKSLSKNKNVSFGLLPASYKRLYGMEETETLKQLHRARIAARENLNQEISLFSYPFGEYSLSYKDIIKQQGYEAAFGLHSGALSTSTDLFELPRFAMTESYGDTSRFRSITQALPFPVSDIEPKDLYLKQDQKQFGFTVTSTLKASLNNLSCYIAGQEPPKVQILNTRVEIFPSAKIEGNRTRLNCTLPGFKNENDEIRWRWFSRILVTD